MTPNNSKNRNVCKVLIIENTEADAEIITSHLKDTTVGYSFHFLYSSENFKNTLIELKPDIVLSEFNIQGSSGFHLLNISKSIFSELPFIFITGSTGEEMAIAAMKSGASDYILKNNLKRLEPSILKAMEEKRTNYEKRKLLSALKKSEEKYRTLLENIPVGVFRTTYSEDSTILQSNTSGAKIFGISNQADYPGLSARELYVDQGDLDRLRKDISEFKSIRNRNIKMKRVTGEEFWASVSAYCHFDSSGEAKWIDGVIEDITERVENERELKRINEELDLLLTSLSSIIIGVSVRDRITHWNPYAEDVFGIRHEDIIGKRFYESGINWSWEIIYETISQCILGERSVRIDELTFLKQDGHYGILGLTINPLLREGNLLEGFIIIGRDVTEQKILESQLLQSNKLEAIGQLAAGVAHEINTPLQYVGDNLRFINKSFNAILNLLDIYERTSTVINDREILSDLMQQILKLRNEIKLEFLLEELPGALEQALEGVSRVSKIVQSMKAFSHPGTGNKMPADINKAVENTAVITRNEWKYDSELKLELDTSLPPVPCIESELNQVLLNLIINAADAIHEAKDRGELDNGVITVKTVREEFYAVIIVEDNGPGIPDTLKDRIFEPFFTTKEVGKGSGQGLPISYSIIVEKHNGMFYFENNPGKGASFIIKLPLEEFE